MEVTFVPTRGSSFQLELGYFDTMLEIKDKIHHALGLPTSKQALVFNGALLRDDLNIHSSDILVRSQIHILVAADAPPPPPDKKQPPSDDGDCNVQLLLKLPVSKLHIVLEMSLLSTVRDLKQKIHDVERVPVARLVVHSNGAELPDAKSLEACELGDKSEINVTIRSSPPASTAAAPVAVRTSSGNAGGGSKKLRVFVVTKCENEKIPVEVNSSDNVRELRKKLQKMKIDLPQEGYFFIYKQIVMDDDRSFRWHHVCQGDIVEIFSGSVSGGS